MTPSRPAGAPAPASASLLGLVMVALAVGGEPAAGQWVDAEQPRGGELLIQLVGSNVSVDQRFEPDGTRRSFAGVLALELDDRLAPRLDSLDAALPGLFAPFDIAPAGPSTLGALKFDVLVERTTIPFNLELGVTDWLSLFTVVPIVHGRSFSSPLVEDSTASAGPSELAFGEDADAFLTDMSAGIQALAMIADAGTLPPDRQQAAEALLANARSMQTGLEGLAGLTYAPTDSSSAGRQIASAYDEIRNGFSEFDVDLPILALATPIAGANAATFITEAEFGIEPPGPRSTGIKLGDIEVGMKLQPLNTFRPRPATSAALRLRLQLGALWRFPTGSEPRAGRLTDPGAGDGQADLELRSTLDLGLGTRFWLTLFSGYTLQFDAELERLLTNPAAPIQFGAQTALVTWDPGDILRLAVLPRFNLTQNITFSGIFVLDHHGRDQLAAVDPAAVDGPFTTADLEEGTEYTARSIGFAARYSSTEWHGARRQGLPVEVELRYLRTVGASDGFVPQRNVWEVALRYYQSIFR